VNRQPDPGRMAIHQAGHAVAQARVGRKRYRVKRLSLGVEPNPSWPEKEARGEAALDRETLLSIYEFGLVTLAGIAAEERYMADQPPEQGPLVALSDIAEWQGQARKVFRDEAQIELVSLNLLQKLREWFVDPTTWQVVEELAAALLREGELDETFIQPLLDRL